MDMSLVRTFLAVVEAGNFKAASQRVHVTQSTVSSRIKALETEVGKTLFIRNKALCEMTASGRRFYRYARALSRIWEEAKYQVAVPTGFTENLIVGGQYSLWDQLLLAWLPQFQAHHSHVALRATLGMPERLIAEMVEGRIDLALLYQPEHRPGLHVERLFDDELVLARADAARDPADGYVFVDWGEAFRAFHSTTFFDTRSPGLTLDSGALALSFVQHNRGSAYFPRSFIARDVREGRLHLDSDSPRLVYPAYVVTQLDYRSPDVMADALTVLRQIVPKHLDTRVT